MCMTAAVQNRSSFVNIKVACVARKPQNIKKKKSRTQIIKPKFCCYQHCTSGFHSIIKTVACKRKKELYNAGIISCFIFHSLSWVRGFCPLLGVALNLWEGLF